MRAPSADQRPAAAQLRARLQPSLRNGNHHNANRHSANQLSQWLRVYLDQLIRPPLGRLPRSSPLPGRVPHINLPPAPLKHRVPTVWLQIMPAADAPQRAHHLGLLAQQAKVAGPVDRAKRAVSSYVWQWYY